MKVGLKELKCPKCNKKIDGSDFIEDWRMKDDLGVIEYYECSRCGEYYYALLRYVKIVKVDDLRGKLE